MEILQHCYKCRQIESHDEIFRTSTGNTHIPSKWAGCRKCGNVKDVSKLDPDWGIITEKMRIERRSRSDHDKRHDYSTYY